MNQKSEHTPIDEENSQSVTTPGNARGIMERATILLSYILAIFTFPISLFFCLITVREYQRVVIFRLGRLRTDAAQGPGYVFVLPCVDDWVKVDIRLNSFEIPLQEILTEDAVCIKVNAIVFYRLLEPMKVVTHVANPEESTKLVTQTIVRNVVSVNSLMNIIVRKKDVSDKIYGVLGTATESWGVEIESVELKDVIIPLSVQKSLAAEAKALSEAMAASTDQERAPAIKYLETLKNIITTSNSNAVFPFPIELTNFCQIENSKHDNTKDQDTPKETTVDQSNKSLV